ncbi:Alkanesulfonates ABC transporter ATP-binding protein [Pediococcus damnosus]|uniref:Alkanesulfonates ABC transporter ATP-binding protein n=1 Tax=Pediococcus damnosus TaxID=51663 RepID=A0A0R2HVS7_9LACO|nr:ABC transporter ATP-binding protein [Pediococcus damnosus]AMV61066.1 Alkanesulfonates ABC transporter ATP-binding protein [Pediococcus damnosus]AMV63631.1 Alkanesulfonates ABC transporter ATP-binding protein [Pediococcus damnosus]AMV65426.1 Alkanesulfonates ABC transporter ATP-binding protein [Pediococcus damnosus]AMV66428.1 Alkanesulfonates ABC transporter ATP-binding protein [Pediococcus damnosus]AMV68730.1 Alkanesulfonates ABC transporter ATP-binding protein [Pediococcus damnosus]
MTKQFVEITDVQKSYGSKQILHDIDLTIADQEFLALVGMSGGGKSTLLRLIAGLEQPSAGEIKFANDNPVIRVMFQNDRLLPWMTVLENVSFQSNQKEQQTEAAKMLELVGLETLASQYPRQLSGGQKQRVALARALMAHPQLLLLDEPLGALDALTRRQMQDLILKICQEQKLTTVLVTHDVNEAVRMADRVVVIRNGTNRYEEAGVSKDDPTKVAVAAERVLHDIMDEETING